MLTALQRLPPIRIEDALLESTIKSVTVALYQRAGLQVAKVRASRIGGDGEVSGTYIVSRNANEALFVLHVYVLGDERGVGHRRMDRTIANRALFTDERSAALVATTEYSRVQIGLEMGLPESRAIGYGMARMPPWQQRTLVDYISDGFMAAATQPEPLDALMSLMLGPVRRALLRLLRLVAEARVVSYNMWPNQLAWFGSLDEPEFRLVELGQSYEYSRGVRVGEVISRSDEGYYRSEPQWMYDSATLQFSVRMLLLMLWPDKYATIQGFSLIGNENLYRQIVRESARRARWELLSGGGGAVELHDTQRFLAAEASGDALAMPLPQPVPVPTLDGAPRMLVTPPSMPLPALSARELPYMTTLEAGAYLRGSGWEIADADRSPNMPQRMAIGDHWRYPVYNHVSKERGLLAMHPILSPSDEIRFVIMRRASETLGDTIAAPLIDTWILRPNQDMVNEDNVMIGFSVMPVLQPLLEWIDVQAGRKSPSGNWPASTWTPPSLLAGPLVQQTKRLRQMGVVHFRLTAQHVVLHRDPSGDPIPLFVDFTHARTFGPNGWNKPPQSHNDPGARYPDGPPQDEAYDLGLLTYTLLDHLLRMQSADTWLRQIVSNAAAADAMAEIFLRYEDRDRWYEFVAVNVLNSMARRGLIDESQSGLADAFVGTPAGFAEGLSDDDDDDDESSSSSSKRSRIGAKYLRIGDRFELRITNGHISTLRAAVTTKINEKARALWYVDSDFAETQADGSVRFKLISRLSVPRRMDGRYIRTKPYTATARLFDMYDEYPTEGMPLAAQQQVEKHRELAKAKVATDLTAAWVVDVGSNGRKVLILVEDYDPTKTLETLVHDNALVYSAVKDRIIEITSEVLGGLDASGTVHRALVPNNVVAYHNGEWRVTDVRRAVPKAGDNSMQDRALLAIGLKFAAWRYHAPMIDVMDIGSWVRNPQIREFLKRYGRAWDSYHVTHRFFIDAIGI